MARKICNSLHTVNVQASPTHIYNIGRLYIAGVPENPPNLIPHQYFQLYGKMKSTWKCITLAYILCQQLVGSNISTAYILLAKMSMFNDHSNYGCEKNCRQTHRRTHTHTHTHTHTQTQYNNPRCTCARGLTRVGVSISRSYAQKMNQGMSCPFPLIIHITKYIAHWDSILVYTQISGSIDVSRNITSEHSLLSSVSESPQSHQFTTISYPTPSSIITPTSLGEKQSKSTIIGLDKTLRFSRERFTNELLVHVVASCKSLYAQSWLYIKVDLSRWALVFMQSRTWSLMLACVHLEKQVLPY